MTAIVTGLDTASPEPAAMFRPYVPSPTWSAIALGVVVYVGVKLMGGPFSAHAFAIAGIFAVGRYFAGLVSSLTAGGIRASADGLEDTTNRLALPWTSIGGIKLDIEEVSLPRLGERTLARVATVSGPAGVIRFSDLGPKGPRRLDGMANLPHAAALLALVAARTKSTVLYPPTWEATARGEATVTTPRVEPHSLRRPIPVGAIALAFKLLPKLGATVLKVVKSIKPGAALVTLGAYSLAFSWQFALALVGMILFHECGHAFAMWRSGVPVKGIYMVPFFGGVAVSRGLARSHAKSAYIALNGPLWGLLLAGVSLTLYVLAPESLPVAGALAAWGAMLNLFNLLPIYPLDGGRVVASLARSLGGAAGNLVVSSSLIAGAALAYVAELELLLLVAILGFIELEQSFAAAPLRAAIALVGRPLRSLEHLHFDRLVGRVEQGAASQSQLTAKLQRFDALWQEALQAPMSFGHGLGVLGAYAVLVALLLAIAAAMHGLPGVGAPLDLLR